MSDMLKYADCMGVVELLRVFQKIMKSGTMPMEFGHSLTIPLYKGKGMQRFDAVGAWHEDLGEGIVQKTKHVTKVDEN